MSGFTATAISHPNIAFIKYWGNRDADLRVPENGSISMNLAGLETRTRVTFSDRFQHDHLMLNGRNITGPALARVAELLNIVRGLANSRMFAQVESSNNFPIGAGLASSAAAFAALALASSSALDLRLSERDLSRLARRGSGSACRSIPDGFVEWQAGGSDEDSYAFSIAPSGAWDLVDCVAVVTTTHKPMGSTEGHALASTSPLQKARVADTPRRLTLCRDALLSKDFDALAQVVELDSNVMHSVMMTSNPPLLYWQPATLSVMQAAIKLRKQGIPACYTIDAGANVHVLTLAEQSGQVASSLKNIPGVCQVITAGTGGPSRLID